MKNFIKNNEIIILLSLLVLSLVINGVLYNKYRDIRNNPQKAVREDTRRLVEKVGELVVLPENEEPTIATVNDPAQLKGHPFFAKAKKGDKVLIFSNAGKSILYDPVANKVIEVASMDVSAPTVESSVSEN